MTLDSRADADLYAFIRNLPRDARFASHPMDGDGIPYYGARATTGTFETLQPWFVNSWQRQKVREFATLDMLYAEHLEEVAAYCRKYSVSHVLINRDRYGADFADRAASFEPFSAYTNELLHRPNRLMPVLAVVRGSAVVFERKPWVILNVSHLPSEAVVAPTQSPKPTR